MKVRKMLSPNTHHYTGIVIFYKAAQSGLGTYALNELFESDSNPRL